VLDAAELRPMESTDDERRMSFSFTARRNSPCAIPFDH
jgi:hypothetical protein